MKRFISVIFLLGTAIGMTGVRALAVEPAGALSRDEVKALVRNAKTSEDHQKLAGYYRYQAEKLQAEIKEHQAMGAEYDKNPLAHPVPKGPTLGEHCRTLARYYGEAGRTAIRMAVMHEEMANRAK